MKVVVAEPVEVVTVTVAAPSATLNAIWNVAVIEVSVVTTLRTRMPGLLGASDAPVKLVPVSETSREVPASPVFGVKAVIVGIAGTRPPVERIILKSSDLVLPIGEDAQIAGEVIDVTLHPIERIFPRRQPIHVVIGVRHGLVLGIGQREQIAVRIVHEAGHTGENRHSRARSD